MSTLQNIVDEVRGELNDEDTSNLRFSDAEMLRFCNAGQREIVTLLPEANTIEQQFQVDDDEDARQTIPITGIKFIKVSSNFDTVAMERGPMLRMIEFDALDTMTGAWINEALPNEPNVPTIQDIYTNVRFENYAHDPRDQKAFWLYPPPHLTLNFDIMLVFSQLPTDAAMLSTTFALSDEYQNAMVEYVLYRCLSRDGRYGPGTSARKELLNNFRQVLGLKVLQDARLDPQQFAPPEGP